MEIGDILQVSIGSLSLIATCAVAWLVYRLEKKERVIERGIQERRDAEKKSAQEKSELARQESERRRQELERQREDRRLRREKHGEDYRTAEIIISEIEDFMSSVFLTPASSEKIQNFDLRGKAKILEKIADRVAGVGEPLEEISYRCAMFDTRNVPAPIHLRVGLKKAQEDPNEMMDFLQKIAGAAVHQEAHRLEILKQIKIAKSALAKEWDR